MPWCVSGASHENPVGPGQDDRPKTSRAAAAAADVTGRAAAVAAVMRDGTPRTDEQIHEAMVAAGHPYTDTSARHGRLTLAKDGLIVKVGVVASQHGRQMMVWQWKESHDRG